MAPDAEQVVDRFLASLEGDTRRVAAGDDLEELAPHRAVLAVRPGRGRLGQVVAGDRRSRIALDHQLVDLAVAVDHRLVVVPLIDDGGEPTGYVHLKDVIDLEDEEFTEPVPPKRIRQLISLFRDTDLEDALATMRRSGLHVARSFDENGGTLGVVFLEDILEELVGEVEDATRRT